jgi:hypothetical protein
VHAKVTVIWKYQTESGNDTHYSLMRGTKADLMIKQGAEEQYKTVLYILPKHPSDFTPARMNDLLKPLESKYPGISSKEVDEEWEVIIPDKYREGHESHFARVTENYLEYLKNHNMPAWEVPNMLAKYYTTTKALELSQKNQ